MVELAGKGVTSLEDLADLAGDELAELLPEMKLDASRAGEIILAARIALGWIEPEPEPTEGDEQEALSEADEATGDGAQQ